MELVKTINVSRHSWSTIKVHHPFNPRPLWAMPAYDKNVFGIDFPKSAFDLVHVMRDKVLSNGEIKKGFEPYKRAANEDKKRIKMLETDGSHDCKLLAEDLQRGIDKPDAFANMASAVWMRRFRRKLIGAVLEMLHPYANTDLSFVTLINKKWIIPIGELHTCKPQLIMEAFRQHLNRAGVTNAPGILFAWLHSEFDPLARCYRHHVHCLCSRDKADNIRRIQKDQLWGYETVKGIKKPIVFRSIKMGEGERERVASYTFQQFWPQRPRYFNPSMEPWKTKDRQRMIPIAEREVLLWLACQRPSDFLLSQPNIRLQGTRHGD